VGDFGYYGCVVCVGVVVFVCGDEDYVGFL